MPCHVSESSKKPRVTQLVGGAEIRTGVLTRVKPLTTGYVGLSLCA